MNVATVLFGLFLFLSGFCTAYSCKGCVNVDQWSWEKIVPKFRAALVKFDVAFPYGDRHDTFTKLAEEFADNKDIIIVQVGVKDYGDKENKELAEKHGIMSKDDLPTVQLFIQNQTTPIDLPLSKNKEWSLSKLRNFVRVNTDIYVGLPGCLEKFDKLANKFIASSNKEEQMKKAELLAKNLKEKEKSSAKTYLLFMKKIIEQGAKFVEQEASRLGKILKDGKVKEQKKEELSQKINILQSFENKKDEL
ncbi:endoplasmic reticulum resident protein 29-like [Agrilus planipennis]|uniref:Endoplasmic reticulum resident protein 29 n=1 Tax=Agrilus planipennis TaxID=224129 RepID=A0A1W4WNQ7_AGRPL|nr:endoplasmic reticulum resident protein 29 [Agrilus planipennis]XP_025836470.1 endoplasmic reticulum resident protein 29-like [Agrilus planipennis]